MRKSSMSEPKDHEYYNISHAKIVDAERLKELESDTYWNHTDNPIVIVAKWHADPLGGPAIHDTTIMILPGDGINISILGLKRDKPNKKGPVS